MKVKLIKRSADGKLIVELEDKVGRLENGDAALRRLEREANFFLEDRQKRLRTKQELAAKPARPAAATTSTVAPTIVTPKRTSLRRRESPPSILPVANTNGPSTVASTSVKPPIGPLL